MAKAAMAKSVEVLARSGERVERFKARGHRYEVKDSIVPGLRLRVAADGARTWTFWYRTKGGAASRTTLGTFPGTSLADARELAEATRGRVKEGADPQGEVRAERARLKAERAAPLAGSVAETVADYLETRRPDLRPVTLREWDRLAARIGDYFGALPVKDLTRVTVREWLATLRSANHPTLRDEAGKPVKVKGYSANRSLEFLRLALDWAADEGRIPANPAAGLRRPSKKRRQNSDILATETKRERALSAMEVRAVLLALNELEEGAHRKGEGRATADALRLALLTGKRRGAVLGLRRSELSGLETEEPLWEVPAEREKNATAHDVPLSPDALAIIRRRLSACDDRRALAKHEAAKAGGKAHPTIGEYLWATHREPKASGADWWSLPEHPQQWLPQRFIKKLKARAAEIHGPMKAWTPHALRATAATLWEDALKVDHRVVSLLLNHKLDNASTRLGYNLARKQSERRAALTEWGERLREWKETEPGKLLPMRARA